MATLFDLLAPHGLTAIGVDGEGGSLLVFIENGEAEPRLLAEDVGVSSLALSPDGSMVAYTQGVSEGSGWLLAQPVEGGPVRRVTDEGVPLMPAWEPRGEQIAFSTSGGDLFVVAVDGSGLRQITSSGDQCVDLYPTWSPDSQLIAFSRECAGDSTQPGLFTMDVVGGEPLLLSEEPSGVHGLAWSPQGERFAAALARGPAAGLYLIDASSGSAELVAEDMNMTHPQWSSDGTRLLFLQEGEVMTHDLQTGDTQPIALPTDLSIVVAAARPRDAA